MTIKITVLLNLTPCILVYLEKLVSSVCSPGDGGAPYFGKTFLNYMKIYSFTSQERIFCNMKATIASKLKKECCHVMRRNPAMSSSKHVTFLIGRFHRFIGHEGPYGE